MSKKSVLQSLEVAETLEDLEKAVHVTLRKLTPADRYWIWQEGKRRHKEEILKMLELAAGVPPQRSLHELHRSDCPGKM